MVKDKKDFAGVIKDFFSKKNKTRKTHF